MTIMHSSSEPDPLLDPRGRLELVRLTLAARPDQARLAGGTLLFYDNLKMDVGHYGAIFARIKAGLQQRGIANFLDYRETIRGKTSADIAALARRFQAMKVIGAVIALADMGVSPAMVALTIELERLGIPTACLTAGPGSQLCVAHAYYRAGSLCLIPFDLYHASNEETVAPLAEACVPTLIGMLSSNGAALEALARVEYDVDARPSAADVAAPEDSASHPAGSSAHLDAVYERFENLHIGDGLPFVPPTAARLENMREYCPFALDEIIFEGIGPSGTPLTVRDALIAAVMAGCREEYAPVVLTALRAIAQPQYGLLQAVTTSFSGGHFVLASGPLAGRIGMHGGQGCLGPGFRANATIGRAVNLALLNVCRSVPGHADLACLSSPAEFSYCMGEDATLSPWPLMHEEQYDPRATMVLVLKAEAPHAVMDLASTRAAGLLETIIDCCTTLGSNNAYAPGCLVLMLNPDHARLLLDSGYDKHRLRNEIHASAGISRAQVSRRGLAGIGPKDGAAGLHKVTRSPEDVEIVVAGGKGGHSAVILPWALNSDPVYAAIRLPDGNFAKSLEQFRWRT